MTTPITVEPDPTTKRPRARLIGAVTLVIAFVVMVGAAREIVALQRQATRNLKAQVALANVAHEVDVVRFGPGGFAQGAAIDSADYARLAHTRQRAAAQSALLAELAPVEGAPIEALVRRLNRLAEAQMDLVVEHRLAAAQLLGRSEIAHLHNELVRAEAAADPILASHAADAGHRATVGRAMILVGMVGLLLLLLARFEVSRRRNIRAVSQRDERRANEERFAALVQNSSEMITVTAADGTILYDSPAVERLLGWSADSRIGAPMSATIHPDDQATVAAQRALLIQNPGDSVTLEFRRQDAQGAWRWVDATATNMLAVPAVGGLVSNYRLVDDRKAHEHDLEEQALRDPLTRCANRSMFRTRVARFLTREERAPEGFAVFYLDLDEFKAVNDGMGHSAGDRVLIAVADRLTAAVREQDVVARLGGDEFAVLIERTEPQPEWYAAVARRLLASFALPIEVDGRLVFVGVSIGVALDDGLAADPDDLLRNADMAMYTAKAHGKGRFAAFADNMVTSGHDRIGLDAEMREGLEQDQFELYYQPIVSLKDGHVAGMEALIRWQHPERGLLPPAEFIGVAEETGFILPLGRWILTEACQQLARWNASGELARPFVLSINVSARQLHDPELVAHLRELVRTHQLDPASILLEITETALLYDVDMAEIWLRELKAIGVQLAIDDFGTGYSSLAHLRRFPIDEVKIDKSFIDGVTRGAEDAAITQAVLKMAEAFGIRTVAEGVERADQQTKLRRMGCDMAQGYLFGRPCRAETALALSISSGVHG